MDLHEENIPVGLEDGAVASATVSCREDADRERTLVLFPPHPSLGGDPDNNVIRALTAAAVASGRVAVCLRYRGTETGEVGGVHVLRYWDALEAQQDYRLVGRDCCRQIAAVQAEFGLGRRLDLAAYSFGMYLAAHVARELPPLALVGISPPVTEYRFAAVLLPPLPCAVTLIGTAADPFCPRPDLRHLAAQTGCRHCEFASDDHFYRGHEPELALFVLDLMEARPPAAPE